MTKKSFLTGIWRFPCKRNLTVVVKQAAWTILFLQVKKSKHTHTHTHTQFPKQK